MTSSEDRDDESKVDFAEVIQLIESGATLGDVLGYSKKSLEAVYAVGYALYKQGKYPDAMRAFGFALTHNHLERRYHMAFGACLQMQKRFEAALKYYGTALMFDMTDPVAAMHMAECFLALSRIDEARAILRNGSLHAAGDPGKKAVKERIDTILALLGDAEQSPPADKDQSSPATKSTKSMRESHV